MYSVVLMMAMTSAPEAPNWGGKGFFHGGALHCLNTCHGCWASCHGCWSSCHGCWSSCHGCWSSCHGCGGGWSYGWSSYACSGCAGHANFYTSCSGNWSNYWQPFSCFGYGIYGGTTYTYPVPYESAPGTYGYGYPIPANSMPRIENKEIEPKKSGETKSMLNADKAQVVVRLPADAKLYANGQLTNLSSGERSFNTPVLEAGQDYQYSMKIEYARGGKAIVEDKIVKVRAGQVSVVEFAEQGKADTAVSTLKFMVPEGATLFVENRAIETTGSEFKTPELAKGAEYAYNVRAELKRGGKVETQTQRVVFKAGEPVTVDFLELGTVRTASK
jgi:uncharacterized protein (TIGR03000 family)